jgi:hypothetical protein
MDDLTMLKFAAKAAGVELGWKKSDGSGDMLPYIGLGSYTPTYWNPLHDSGDRYRLLSKLKACIDFQSQFAVMGDVCVRWPEDEPDEARAVVRAAAEIGKRMEIDG